MPRKSVAASTLLLFALVSILSLPQFTRPVAARYFDQPPPQAGWTHQSYLPGRPDTAAGHGVELPGKAIFRSSPVIADIDGNPASLEVAVGGSDGTLYVLRSNGSIFWQKQVVSCATSEELIASSPAVGTIFGGSTPYVVVGYGTVANSNCDGGVVAYRGDGTEAWRFSARAYGQSQGLPPEAGYGVISSPALGDIDGDGRLEVAFGGLDRNVYLLNHNGTVKWYYHAADSVWSTPVFVDGAGDSRPELLFATDISFNAELLTPDGGYIHLIDPRSPTKTRIDFYKDGLGASPFIYRKAFDQVIYSSPSVADILPERSGLEFAVGAGCYFPAGAQPQPRRGQWVKLFDLESGEEIRTMVAPECVQSSPALGDIDDDGRLEIVVNVGSFLDTTITGSRVIAYEPETGAIKWNKTPALPTDGSSDESGGDIQSPVIADIDGNGSLEVLTANKAAIHVIDGKTGNFLTCQGPDPSCGSQKAMYTWSTVKTTPAVGDLDKDGDLEVVIGGSHDARLPNGMAVIYAWTNLQGNITASSPGNQGAYSAPWPQFNGGPTRNGLILRPRIAPSTTGVGAMLEANGSEVAQITVGAVSAAPGASWTLEESDPNNIVTPAKTSGAFGESLGLTFNAGSLAVGSYSATLTFKSAGADDVAVTVSLRVVAERSVVAIPMTLR